MGDFADCRIHPDELQGLGVHVSEEFVTQVVAGFCVFGGLKMIDDEAAGVVGGRVTAYFTHEYVVPKITARLGGGGKSWIELIATAEGDGRVRLVDAQGCGAFSRSDLAQHCHGIVVVH